MQKEYYLPHGDNERDVWLSNFVTKVAALPAGFNILPAQNTSLSNDSAAFHYDLLLLEAAHTFSQTCTANKDSLRDGPQTATPLAFPAFVAPAGAPTPVLPGVFERVVLVAGQIKKNALFTEAYGISLGIIGADVITHFATAQPGLSLSLEGGHVHIKYAFQHTDGLYLFSMRGTETEFTLLATITKNTYNDTRPNLVVGVPEKRQYRAFYMVADVMVGIESAVVSITC